MTTITFDVLSDFGGEIPENFQSPGLSTYRWRTILAVEDRTMEVPFFEHQGEMPTIGDVLSCVQSDARLGEDPFGEFCANLGYDTDSRSAYATWEACREQARKLRDLLGGAFDEFMDLDAEDVEQPDSDDTFEF